MEDGRTLHQGWSPQCERQPRSDNAEWGVLRTTAIQPGEFRPEHNKRLPSILAPRQQIEVKAGDILITCAGPRSRCGVSCLVRTTPPRLMISGKMYRFRVPEDHLESRFLEAFLRSPAAREAIDGMKTGGSDSGLNLTHERFLRLMVPVASLDEQRRIVEALEEVSSDLDAGVAALERVRERLSLYRASVLKSAVEGALTVEWRAQHPDAEPATQLLKRILAERRCRWEEDQLTQFKAKGREPPHHWNAKYKEPVAADTTNLPPLPAGWCWATVDQCAALVQYGSSAKTGDDLRGIPVLRMGNLTTDGRLATDAMKYLPPSHHEFPSLLLRPGDLLFNRTNSADLVGKTALYSGTPSPCSFASYLIRVRLLEWVIPQWLVYVLTGGFGRAWVKRVANQTVGQANVNGAKLAAFSFPLPSLPEQEAITEVVEDQFSVIDHLEADLGAKLKSSLGLQRAVLRHAFSGQLVAQNPKDDPASELLKRIVAERETRSHDYTAKKRAAGGLRGRSKKGKLL